MRTVSLIMISIIWSVSIGYAQKIRVTGKVLDGTTNGPAEFVNVVLRTPDSAFVAGTSTDMEGRFQLEKIQKGTYRLIVSAIGYADYITDLNSLSESVDLGELLLNEATEQLGEVTVTASNVVNQSDRKIIFPSREELAASTNGANLLEAMMLPRIQVDPITKAISASGGGKVQLCINGAKMDEKDITALQPQDIVRIEYIENPGLRYGDTEAVLNYITRRHKAGGSVSVDMMNSPLIVFHNDEVSARFNNKKSEFSLYYNASPRDFFQTWRTNQETFHFEDGTLLNRTEEGIPGRLTELNHSGAFAYSYQEPDKYLLNAKFGYWGYLQPHTDFKSDIYSAQYPDDVTEMRDLKDRKTHRPYVDLYYQHNLKHKQFLAINVVATYIYSDSKRTYQEKQNEELLTDIFSGVTGNKYSVIGEGIYEKEFEKGRLSAGLQHTQAFSDNTYSGNLPYTTNMKQAETYLYSEFQGKWKKLDYTLGVGATRSYLKQEGEAGYQTYTFRPRFSLRYAFSDQLYARLNGRLVNNSPALSELSAVEQLIDSMQIQRGNPALNPYNTYQADLYLEYRIGPVSAGLSSRYRNSPKAIMESTFTENGMFVHTYENQDGFQSFNGELNLRAGLLRNILQVSLTGGVNRFRSDGKEYLHTYTNWYFKADVMAQYKNLTAAFSIYNRRNNFWGESMSSGENMHMLMLRYKYKQIAVGAGMINPFANNYKRIDENWNKHVSSYKEMYINESSRLFFLTFAWNFQFGRKYQTGDKMLNNEDSESGVMNAGK